MAIREENVDSDSTNKFVVPGKTQSEILKLITDDKKDVEIIIGQRHISFKIESGENVGIIGKTGSGKTTLVDLILRTYNVEDNTILVDGKDVNDISIKSLRKHCAYVPQDNFLFSDTIENNIAFAKGENPLTVVEAATLSDVHNNIEQFTEKYKTVYARCWQ